MFEYCKTLVLGHHFILGLLVDKRAQEKNNKMAEIFPKVLYKK